MRTIAVQQQGANLIDARITNLRHEKEGATSRVLAELDGKSFFFECSDLELQASPEAMGNLWLIPSILSGRNLKLEQPLCPTWHTNALRVIDFLHRNWGSAVISVDTTCPEQRSGLNTEAGLDANAGLDAENGTSKDEAVFFSGGLDSFYTATRQPYPRYLVYIEGFETPLISAEFARDARERLCSLAEQIGSIPVTVRTNIHNHPTFLQHRFADTHAGLLGAVGHLLAKHIGSIKISPSWSMTYPAIGGNYHRLNPLWSSKRLTVIHAHGETTRAERAAAVADMDIVRKNLRVCVDLKRIGRNCSRCEKCIRTMLIWHYLGKLEKFSAFDQSLPLIEAIDGVEKVPVLDDYEYILAKGIDAPTDEAVRRMLRRSYMRTWKIEETVKFQRLVDEEYPKLKDGLANALHHYTLLQKNYDDLLKDYKEVSSKKPFNRGARAVRHLVRMLRRNRYGSANKDNPR